MSFVLFKDSFEAYKVAASSDPDLLKNMRERYTFARGGFAIDNTGGIGQELFMQNSSVGKTLAHSARWVCGMRYKYSSSGLSNSLLYQLQNNGTELFDIQQNTDGTLAIRTAGGTTVIGVTTRSLFSDIRYMIEWDVEFTGATPIMVTAELRINGHVEIASATVSTGINASTLLSGDATANFHIFDAVGGGAGTASWLKDIYIKNEAGYEGDVRNVPMYPASDGGILDWTPNSGGVHFDRVNTHPVDRTKWLETATPGDIDLWGFTLPSFSGTIPAINIRVLVQKDDEGTKSFKIVVGPTGTDATSDEFFVSSNNPEYYEFSLKQNPVTGLDWVPGDSIDIGVECIS